MDKGKPVTVTTVVSDTWMPSLTVKIQFHEKQNQITAFYLPCLPLQLQIQPLEADTMRAP